MPVWPSPRRLADRRPAESLGRAARDQAETELRKAPRTMPTAHRAHGATSGVLFRDWSSARPVGADARTRLSGAAISTPPCRRPESPPGGRHAIAGTSVRGNRATGRDCTGLARQALVGRPESVRHDWGIAPGRQAAVAQRAGEPVNRSRRSGRPTGAAALSHAGVRIVNDQIQPRNRCTQRPIGPCAGRLGPQASVRRQAPSSVSTDRRRPRPSAAPAASTGRRAPSGFAC
jgi:hypothetical protein